MESKRVQQLVGERVKRLRDRRGWTQEALGLAIGDVTGTPWSKALVSQAENGQRRFTAEDLVVLAATFKITPSALLVLEVEPGAEESTTVELGGRHKTLDELQPVGGWPDPDSASVRTAEIMRLAVQLQATHEATGAALDTALNAFATARTEHARVQDALDDLNTLVGQLRRETLRQAQG